MAETRIWVIQPLFSSASPDWNLKAGARTLSSSLETSAKPLPAASLFAITTISIPFSILDLLSRKNSLTILLTLFRATAPPTFLLAVIPILEKARLLGLRKTIKLLVRSLLPSSVTLRNWTLLRSLSSFVNEKFLGRDGLFSLSLDRRGSG